MFKGAKINAKDKFGKSALYFSCLGSNKIISKYLLENGADDFNGGSNYYFLLKK